MNNKINDLAHIAHEKSYKEYLTLLETEKADKVFFYDMFNRNFALLIIKDCEISLSPMLRDMISRGQAINIIKKHFGVNE